VRALTQFRFQEIILSVMMDFRLSWILREWQDFTRKERERWRTGVSFSAFRPSMLCLDGNVEQKERNLVVFKDRIEAIDPANRAFSVVLKFDEISMVSRGSKYRKREIMITTRSDKKEVFSVLNTLGFLFAFQFNFAKWRRRKGKQIEEQQKHVFAVKFEDSFENFLPKIKISEPTEVEKRKLVGDVSQLVPPLKNIFNYEATAIFPKAWKDDWVGIRGEKSAACQSYQEWKRDQFVPAGQSKNKIYLVVIGDLDERNAGLEIRKLVQFLRAYFYGIGFGLMAQIPLKGTHQDQGVKLQMNLSASLLSLVDCRKVLSKLLPHDAFHLIAITQHEISAGEGYLDGNPWHTLPETMHRARKDRFSVLSISRLISAIPKSRKLDAPLLKRKAQLLRRTCLSTASHLLRVCKLDLCVFGQCLMNGFEHLEELDLKTFELCPSCLRKLADCLGIHTSTRMETRFVAIAEFFHLQSFQADERKTRHMARVIEADILRFRTEKELQRRFG